jgi:four helix bundle protein
MSTLKRFEDIKVWKDARELTKCVYQVSSSGEFARDFGLRDQMRRAAVSVVSNIAEGFERDGNREFLQFLSQAKGSCGEMRAQLYIALDLGYVKAEECESLLTMAVNISRQISGLISYLKGCDMRGKKFRPLASP